MKTSPATRLDPALFDATKPALWTGGGPGLRNFVPVVDDGALQIVGAAMGTLAPMSGLPTVPDLHEPELDPPFDVIEPLDFGIAASSVLASLWVGLSPRRFLESSRLDAPALRRSEDAFVDDLFSGVHGLGAPLIRARFPRAYLDLNREPYELDPRMFDGRLPPFANTRSVRVAGGLGTIARVVGESQEIYAGRLSVTEVLARVERLYKPYHAQLRALIDRALARFGTALLVDCHSMPSLPATVAGPTEKRIKTDFVIGDRYGTSSHIDFVDIVEDRLRTEGYVVQRNKPYAGGYITEHYGMPQTGCHAIQIEVNRALYMDERQLVRIARFDSVAADITRMLSSVSDAVTTHGFGRKAAAE